MSQVFGSGVDRSAVTLLEWNLDSLYWQESEREWYNYA